MPVKSRLVENSAAIRAALHEASMLIAHADDQLTTRREVSAVVDRLLSNIRTAARIASAGNAVTSNADRCMDA
jgi:hypothetical protein